uniref:proton-translocating NAD(P)(+) transhydrogenase n=2 Tax=Aquisalinus luteolus TaxID=1566827 RepID=A0A8J3A243_9PROT|nr:NAD(P) transhydrogenase subunit alpha [Aquisalinus luteolus]GGH93195.1 NAD(P) transhydrogenase subunit alpha [Aquisalinus luteolus]
MMFFMQDSDKEMAAQTAEEAERTVEEIRETAEAARQAADNLDASADALNGQIGALQALTDTAHVNEFIYLFAIFILAIFVGYYVVWSVTAALHTPLMSVTNAISSVVIVGALIAVGAEVADTAAGGWSMALGVIAVALASVNIFGGFMVTQRMLAMYKKKEKPAPKAQG